MDDLDRAEREGDGAALHRRAFVVAAIAATVAAAGGAAGTAMTRSRHSEGGGSSAQAGPDPSGQGRLQARPRPATAGAPLPGVHRLGLAGGDGLLGVPAGYEPGAAAPLVVALHGAGGNAAGGMALWHGVADAVGLVVVAPTSRRHTWDVLVGGYGPDVGFLDKALDHVFSRLDVDGRRLAISGFSDGASYALSLGLANGDLFTHGIAFSPGFTAEPDRRGRPRFYVSHGVHDGVLPIDRCSRRIVPALRDDGYEVDYREFDGPHTVPGDQVEAATAWLLGS